MDLGKEVEEKLLEIKDGKKRAEARKKEVLKAMKKLNPKFKPSDLDPPKGAKPKKRKPKTVAKKKK